MKERKAEFNIIDGHHSFLKSRRHEKSCEFVQVCPKKG